MKRTATECKYCSCGFQLNKNGKIVPLILNRTYSNSANRMTPKTGLKVAKWRVFCHKAKLQSGATLLNQVSLTVPFLGFWILQVISS